MTIDELVQEAHSNAVKHGWWPTRKARTFGDLMALLHSEVSEAFEQYRNGHDMTETWYSYGRPKLLDLKPEGIPSELADIIIRVADICGQYDINLNDILIEKMAYNRTRPMRHGGKKV